MPHRQTPGLGPSLAPPRRPERTLAVALAAVIAFNQPLLRIFDLGADATVAGLPVVYLYLFAAWGLVIGLLAAAVETSGKQQLTPYGSSLTAEPAEPPRQGGATAPPSERPEA